MRRSYGVRTWTSGMRICERRLRPRRRRLGRSLRYIPVSESFSQDTPRIPRAHRSGSQGRNRGS